MIQFEALACLSVDLLDFSRGCRDGCRSECLVNQPSIESNLIMMESEGIHPFRQEDERKKTRIWFVWLVLFVWLLEPDQPDRPEEPDELDKLIYGSGRLDLADHDH